MKPLYLFLILILLTTACDQKQAVDENKTPNALDDKLDTYFTTLNEIGKFNGVLSVSQNGKEVIHKAYNLSTDASNSLHVTANSQFDIHSVSKVMARFLILKLEEQNKISKQDKLSSFIPNFPKGEEMTIDMLLENRSGLPRELSNFEGRMIDLEIEELIELIKKEALLFEPGTSQQYSNLGFQLIYYIIGQQTATTFENHLHDVLFAPLQMTDSGAHFYSKNKNLKRLAANHESDGDAIEKVDNILEDEFQQAKLYSTAADLNKLLDEFQRNPLASKLAKDKIIQHSGGSDGIRAHIYANLDTKTNYVLFANFDGIPWDMTLQDMSRILEGKPYDIPKAINRKATQVETAVLQKYTGTYVFRDLGNLELTVKVEKNGLAIYEGEELNSNLFAENDSTFFNNPKAAESIEFIRNAKGGFDVLMGFKGTRLPGIKIK